MPFEVESPFSAAANAAASYMGGVESRRKTQIDEERQKRQDSYQAALAQQSASRLQLEAQRGEREQTTFGNAQTDRATALRQDEAVRKQNAGLRYPAGWQKMSPAMQIAYLRKRQQAEQGIGNAEGFTQTQREVGDLETQLRAEQTRQAEEHRQAVALAAQAQQGALTRAGENERFSLGQGNENARFSAGQAGSDERQLHSEAAALARQQGGQAFTQAQQARLFKHEDATAAAKAAAKKTTADKLNPEYVKQWSALSGGPGGITLQLLPGDLRVRLQHAVLTGGTVPAVAALKAVAGGAPSAQFTQAEAAAVLQAITSAL